MSAPNLRPGFTLVELVVATTLLLLLLAIASITTRQAIATGARVAVQGSRDDEASDALRTIARHSAGIEPTAGDLRMARDTVLELQHTIGVATACRAAGDTLLLSMAHDSLPWATSMPRAVTSDDQLRIQHDGDGRWIARGIRAVASATGSCGDSAGAWPGVASQRVMLDSGASGVRPGAVVRVLQRERWSLRRGGDGNWSLSLATWNAGAGAFGTPQPLLSPLAAPSSPDGSGLVVHAIDADGAVLTDSAALRRARSLLVTLRTAPHVRHGRYADSIRVNVDGH